MLTICFVLTDEMHFVSLIFSPNQKCHMRAQGLPVQDRIPVVCGHRED